MIAILLLLTLATAYDWTAVDKIIQDAISARTFPGAVLGIATDKEILYTKAYGTQTYKQDMYTPSVNLDSKWDLASLTKVVGTLSAVMHLYDDKKIHIDDLVTKFVPQYDNNMKRNTTIKNLLLHNAGLLPDYPGTLPATAEEVMKFIYFCKLENPVGTKFVYSDLSFLMLGQIVQRVTNRTLDNYLKQIFQEMSMKETVFNPPTSDWYRIPPTEFDVRTRHELIRGVVHDPTAYLFKGVAGHAGLFSTLTDMIKYMRIHLNGGQVPGDIRIYPKTTVELFSQRVDGLPYNNTRALGWDTIPNQTYPPCGHKFSPNSFGHTGFTGTSIWADKDKKLIIVLLTNRVHPTASNNAHVKVRSDVSDAIVDAMGL